MSYLFAVGITVGLLAGAWVYFSGTLTLIGFAGFLGWATYFAAGGGIKGFSSALCSNISGVIWGIVTIWAMGMFSAVPSIIFVILFAAIMCWQAKLPWLSFIPGTFIGNATFYATENDALGAIIGLIIGSCLGLVSDYSAKKISKNADN